ncbi:MBG domain-containing protein [Methylorubrum podarium]|uniref:MBG domain-containing protein n=1 Tax=Methylorubrum podarium TaxID=200476 RepID=A0ABV1QU02_9HYPH
MGTSGPYRDARYQLASDIDATGTAAWNGGAGFAPVGSRSAPFTGSLDGAGRTITGLTIARPGQDNVGLIGFLGSGGRVSGLGLVGGSVSGANYVGSLVGYNTGGTVSQSYTTGSVTGGFVVGGLVGANDGGEVNQSYASGRVTGSMGSAYLGGLVGLNVNANGAVTESYATGSVTGLFYVGGLVGSNGGGTVRRSYASGRVTGSSIVGGLVGINRGTIDTSYWDTQSTGRATGVGDGSPAGATGLTSAQARDASSYAGWDFLTVWYQAGDLRPILRSEAVQVGGVYQVSNLNQLQLMGADLGGSYVLTRDLDASATAGTDAAPGPFGAGGFMPVGIVSAPFTGSLNGAGHTITGLTIVRPSYVGLIGSLGPGGSVSDVGLVGGSAHGTFYVGGLVGFNNGGTVSQSYASGSVSGTSTVGGLVGFNNSGTVSQSYASGSVSGGSNSYYVGGLVGYNSAGGTVSQSYATGSVSGSTYVGGLVGSNVGTVSQSYASGSVSGTTAVGGLVGSKVGGAIGTSYWDTQSTGQASGVGTGLSTGTTGLTSAQARSGLSNYTGFDPAVWYQAGDLRPILRSEAVQVGGVYQVSNLHQLQLMGANLAGNYVLTRDIDASATISSVASAGVFGLGGFVPVGSSSTPFTGRLDGAGQTITGLTINLPGQASYVGMFGALGTGGSVSNLGLVGGSISGSMVVGALAGENDGTITGAYATSAVTASSSLSFAGGLVGANAGRIDTSYATGTVNGFSSTGGLAGANTGRIDTSYATGPVRGGGGSNGVGGLVGANLGAVSVAYASGAVAGEANVGGLVGTNGSAGNILQAYATGAVSGVTGGAGGLVGQNGGRVAQTYATGRVTGGDFTGGLVGGNNAGGTVTTSLWDTQTSGLGTGIGLNGAGGATGLATAQMQDLSAFRTTYAGFDFATVWAPPNQAGQGGLSTAYYPQLYGTAKVVAVTPVTSRPYGDANPPLIASYVGLQPGDFVTTPGSLTTGATATSDVGSYAATAAGSAITSPAGTSYRILSVPGTLSVTPRPVTVTADAQSRLYGDANPSLTYTTTSLGSGAALSGSLATAAGPASDVDPYPITQGTLTASANPNYALTYVGATLTVTPRPLTVTGGTISRVYGDANPTSTTAFSAPTGSAGSGSGLVNGDTIASVALASATADATSGVGGYSFTPGSALFGTGSAANYQISYAPGTLSVTPRPVTVTADAQTRLYGDANPSLTYTTTSLGSGAPLSGTLTTADATASVGSYAIGQGTLTGTANPNYALTYVGANLTITPRPLIVTGGTISRLYGDANPVTTTAFTAPAGSAGSGGGLVNGDTISSVAVASATADAASGVGSYGFTPGSALFSTGSAANYQIRYVPGTLLVTARPVTITADAQTRLYGEPNPSLTYTATSLGSGAPLSGSLATADATTGVGSYAIGQGTLTGTANPNYALTYVGANLTIDPRPLIVTGGTISRVYGDANPATTTAFVAPTGSTGSGGGLVNGDTIASVAVASVTADATTGVGSYGFTPGSARFSAGSAGNYRISYVPGTLLVTARPVTITADAQTRVYGDANPALTYAVGGRGLVNGDSLSGGLATPATPASGVGPYAITQGNLAASANYALTYQGADLAVTARPVTVTAEAKSRVYGEVNPALTYTTTALGAGAALSGTLATAATAASDVGTYAITQGSLTAAANPNYALTYVGAGLAVTPRPVTVTADAQTRLYGEADPALTYTVGGLGLVNGDRLGGGLASAADARSPVGRYAITQGSLAASANYALTYEGADLTVTPRPVTLSGTRVYDAGTDIAGELLTPGNLVNGDRVSVSGRGGLAGRDVGLQAVTDLSGLRLSSGNYTLAGASGAVTITPATLTYTADAVRRSYGAANPVLSGTVTGFLGTDTRADATTGEARFTTAAGTGSNVGAYAVTGSGLAAGNYRFVQAAGNATALIVDPAGLTVTGSKTYDGTTAFSVSQLTVVGGVNGEAVTLAAGAGTAASADAGTDVGAGLTGLGLSVAGGNGQAANYRLPTTGTFTITPATVGVRVHDGRSTYGDRPVDPGLAATGLVGGQGVAVLTGLSTGFSLDAASPAGRYTVAVAGRLTNGNYRIGTSEAGTYTIDRRPITVTADAQTRLYGDAEPALTYAVGGSGLANGYRLTGALATSAGLRSGIGPYSIVQGTLAASANYALTYRGADLTVTARPITVFADPQTRPAGTANPALTYTVGGLGLVAGDTLTGALATTADTESAPGVYAITQGSLTASANYRLGFVGADLTVLPRQPQPQPQPTPVLLDAGRLASTAERAARLDGTPAAPALPLLLVAAPDGTLVAADPRFDAALVCAGRQGGCFLAPPALLAAPKPQAGLPAAAR